jgi:hypothetical protein
MTNRVNVIGNNLPSSNQPDNGDQPYIIRISGDDDLSRFGRTNNLRLIKCVRKASGLDIRQSADLVQALRLRAFDPSDSVVSEAISSLGLSASLERVHAIQEGIRRGIAEIAQASPFGSDVI